MEGTCNLENGMSLNNNNFSQNTHTHRVRVDLAGDLSFQLLIETDSSIYYMQSDLFTVRQNRFLEFSIRLCKHQPLVLGSLVTMQFFSSLIFIFCKVIAMSLL